MFFWSSAAFFSRLIFSKKIIQEHYQSVKQVESRYAGSELFAKVINRRQKSTLAGKGLICLKV